MKTMASPNAALDAASGSTAADNQPAMQVVSGTEISFQTDHPPLRVAHKCIGKICVRWQQNRCGAIKNMQDVMQQKEEINQRVSS